MGKFALRFNNITCSGTSAKAADIMAGEGNLQHRITFSIDGTTTTASKDFIPTRILSCTASLSEPVDITIASPATVCLNYTITSDSNVAQTYNLSAGAPPPTCTVDAIYDSVGCTGSVITQKTVPARGTGIFSVQVIVNTDGPPVCAVVTVVTSTMVSTCTDSDLVFILP